MNEFDLDGARSEAETIGGSERSPGVHNPSPSRAIGADQNARPEATPSQLLADGLLAEPERLLNLFRELARNEIGVGSTFDGFTLERKIGEGGMGVVYEATQASPRRRVAIKLIPARCLSKGAHQRLRFERQLLAGLDHPNVAKVFAAGCTIDANGDEIPYFAMDLVPNARPLTTYAREQQLALRERVKLFAVACHAVGYGHTRGVIHRDIKPANVLVGDDGAPRVIDFGIARAISAEFTEFAPTSSCSTWLGTVEYMAPEQFPNAEDVSDTRSDVFSLGITLHELLTGARPGSMRGQRSVSAHSPSLARLVGADLARLLTKATADAPEDRYSSASELADDLDRWLRGDPLAARSASIGYLIRHSLRRNRARGFLVASALLVALLAGALQRATRNTLTANNDARFQLYTKQLAAAAAAVGSDGRAQLPALLRGLAVDPPAWEARMLAAFESDFSLDLRWDVPVRALAFFSGDQILIGDDAGRISLVDVSDPDRRVVIAQVEGGVVGFGVANDSSRILARNDAGHVTLIDVASMSLQRSWNVDAAAMSRDGRRLYYFTEGHFRVCSLDTNVILHDLSFSESQGFHACFLSHGEERVLALGSDSLAFNFHAEEHRYTRDLHAFGKILSAAWIGPNSYALVSTNNGFLRCDDGTVRTFETRLEYGTAELVDCSADGEVIAMGDTVGRVMTMFPSRPPHYRARFGHLGPVTAVCLSADGGWVASAGADGHIRVTSSYAPVRPKPESRTTQFRYIAGRLSNDAVHAVLVSEHGAAMRCNTKSLDILATWRVPSMRPSSVAMTSDARTVAVGCSNGQTWLVTEPGNAAWLIPGDGSSVLGMAFVEDRDLVVLYSSGLLRKVDHQSGAERWSHQLESCGPGFQRGSERVVIQDSSRAHVALAGAHEIALTVRLRDGHIEDRVRRNLSAPTGVLGPRSNIVACTHLPARNEWLVASDDSRLARVQRDADGQWAVTGELHGIPISFVFPTPDADRAACVSRSGYITPIDLERFEALPLFSTVRSGIAAVQLLPDGTLFMICPGVREFFVLSPAPATAAPDPRSASAPTVSSQKTPAPNPSPFPDPTR